MKKCLLFCQILMKLEFSHRYEKNTQIPIYMKIRPVGVEIFHEDGQKDKYVEVKSVFAILERA